MVPYDVVVSTTSNPPPLLPDDHPLVAYWIGRSGARSAGLRCTSNFVVSLDGKVTWNGRSGAMAGPADRTVFQLIRNASDVIVVGAATAAAEGYHAPAVPAEMAAHRRDRSEQPALCLITNGGELGSPPCLGDPATMVACPAKAEAAVKSAAPGLRRLVLGENRLDLAELAAELRAAGFNDQLWEGGPRVLTTAVAQGFIDELNITIAPRLIGEGPALVDSSDDQRRWLLEYQCAVGGDLYCRYSAPR